MRKKFLALILLSMLLSCQLAFSAWSTDPTVNTPVCTATNEQQYPQIVSDGSGGAIIVWQDQRSVGYELFAQHIDAKGNPLWITDGVSVSTSPYTLVNHQLISDGSGGAIITYQDFGGVTGDDDIYAQRLDPNGNAMWTADGVSVCSAFSYQSYPQLVSDGSGGAIIVWEDWRRSLFTDIYAQRLDSSGNALWSVDGVAVRTAFGQASPPQLISDGSGGAIITWSEMSPEFHWDIYAQRLDSNGNALWTADGVAVSKAPYDQISPQIIPDGPGGVIIAWDDRRNGVDSDIYAQRLDSNGNFLWTTNGVPVCMAFDYQYSPQLISDDAGGAIVTWNDYRSGTSDIYAQRLDHNGNALWTANGVPACTAPYDQRSPQIISAGSGGAIITWYDSRNASGYDIYAMRLNPSGNPLWRANGVAVSTGVVEKYSPKLVSDGSGGAIITWEDYRNVSSYADIYAQLLNSSGFLGQGVVSELIIPWYNDSGNTMASFVTLFNPSPQTVVVAVTYSGTEGQGATPSVNTFTLPAQRAMSCRPYQVSGIGEGGEAGPPWSIPKATGSGAWGNAIFQATMPPGYSLVGDTLRIGLMPELGLFSGIAPAYSK